MAPSCLGTRLIVLTASSDKGGLKLVPKQGVISVSQDPANQSALHLAIFNGESTFKTMIVLSKVGIANQQRLPSYFLQDGARPSGLSIELGYATQEQIRLSIKEKIQSGIIKLAYEVDLKKDKSTPSTLLSFVNDIGQSLNRSTEKIQTLKVEMAALEKKNDAWRDTAEKLSDEHWQKDRDQLLHNFLQVFQTAKDTAQETIHELKEEVSMLQNRKGRVLTWETDAPDDLDQKKEPISMLEAAALASGKKTTQARKAPILSSSEIVSASDMAAESKKYQAKRTQQAVRDDAPKRKRTKHQSSDSDEDGKLSVDNKIPQQTNLKEESDATVDEPVKKLRRAPVNNASSNSDISGDDAGVNKQPSRKKAAQKPSLSSSSDSDNDNDGPTTTSSLLKPTIAPKAQPPDSDSDTDMSASPIKNPQRTTSKKLADSDSDTDMSASPIKKPQRTTSKKLVDSDSDTDISLPSPAAKFTSRKAAPKPPVPATKTDGGKKDDDQSSKALSDKRAKLEALLGDDSDSDSDT